MTAGRAMASAVVGGAVGAVVWAGLAYALYALDPKRAISAGVVWGVLFVGGWVGVVVRFRAGWASRRGRLLSAVVVTVVAGNLGRLLADEAAVAGVTHAADRLPAVQPVQLVALDAYRIADDRMGRGVEVVWPTTPTPGGHGYPPDIWAEALARWDALTEGERQARLAEARAVVVANTRAAVRFVRAGRPGPVAGSSFAWADLAWLAVAVGVAAYLADHREK